MTPDGPLFDQPLSEPRMKRLGEPQENAEHAVGIEWRKTVDPAQAKRFKGVFANQNCWFSFGSALGCVQLRHPVA